MLYCGHCGSPRPEQEPDGQAWRCARCGGECPAPEGEAAADAVAVDLVCAICRSPILPASEQTQSCPECDTLYHEECWQENRGCAIYGCSEMPGQDPHRAVEIPFSYWGQEHKECPGCGERIQAAAIRCRHCGTVLPTAQPLSQREFREHKQRKSRLPRLRRAVTVLLVFSLLPFSAPLAAVFGFLWYRSRSEEIAEMPSLYAGLCRVALVVAAGQTVLFSAILFLTTVLPDFG